MNKGWTLVGSLAVVAVACVGARAEGSARRPALQLLESARTLSFDTTTPQEDEAVVVRISCRIGDRDCRSRERRQEQANSRARQREQMNRDHQSWQRRERAYRRGGSAGDYDDGDDGGSTHTDGEGGSTDRDAEGRIIRTCRASDSGVFICVPR